MGDVATNQLQMIDIPLSLAAGTAQLPVNEPGYPPPANYTPPAGFSLVGGLTGLVGTNQVYPTVAAMLQLVPAQRAPARPADGGNLDRRDKPQRGPGPGPPVHHGVGEGNPARRSVRSRQPEQQFPCLTGVPEGSVDSSLALNTIVGTTPGITPIP